MPGSRKKDSTDNPYTAIINTEPLRPVQMWPNLERAINVLLPESQSTETTDQAAEFEWGGMDVDAYKRRAIPVELQRRNAPNDGEHVNHSLGTGDSDDDSEAHVKRPFVTNVVSLAKTPGWHEGRAIKIEPGEAEIEDESENTAHMDVNEESADAMEKEEDVTVKSEGTSSMPLDAGSKDESLQCKICYRIYPTMVQLNIHSRRCVPPEGGNYRKVQEEEVGFKPKICPETFKVQDTLLPQRCEICKQEFANIYLLQVHLDNNHFWCKKCKRTLKNKSQLQLHSVFDIECKKCEKTFCTRADLKEHVNEAHTTPFKCAVCYSSFISGLALKQHKSEAVECEHCKVSFCSKKKLQKHKTSLHRVKCTRCQCTFNSEEQLEKHMGRHILLECDICGKQIKGRAHLKTHKQRIHSGQPRHAMPCELCGKQYKGVKSLEQHKVTDHGAEGRYKCDVCGKQYVVRQRYHMHMRTHTGEKPYQCTICGKAFTLASSLYVHQMKHTDERNFKCTMCDASYTTKYYLKAHMNKHDPTRAVKCPVCFKTFRSPELLKVHKQIHANERKHKCDICGTAYNNSGSLWTHKKKHRDRNETI